MKHRIINLSIDGNGYPIIPGSTLVLRVNDQYYQAKSAPIKAFGCAILPNLATCYIDDSGNWLVSAATEEMLDQIGDGATLGSLVDSNPGNWHCYKCNVDDEIDYTVVRRGVSTLNKGLVTALSKVNQLDVPAVGLYNIFGLQAAVPAGCGEGFRPDDIAQGVPVWGDTITQLSAISGQIRSVV